MIMRFKIQSPTRRPCAGTFDVPTPKGLFVLKDERQCTVSHFILNANSIENVLLRNSLPLKETSLNRKIAEGIEKLC